MKSVLALATFALAILVLEGKARQVAADAQGAYGETVDRVRSVAADTRRATTNRPIPSLLVASLVGYGLSRLTRLIGID
ncbi:hypothetical protein [Acidisoma sp. L85]|uniref:hypothetical protein n=1 Tax=Acidisoma sp. L85 TaxID=1641850 RepID=UPI00131E5C4E|nr:hypothetical protein [Acidisoma sp. L85]